MGGIVDILVKRLHPLACVVSLIGLGVLLTLPFFDEAYDPKEVAFSPGRSASHYTHTLTNTYNYTLSEEKLFATLQEETGASSRFDVYHDYLLRHFPSPHSVSVLAGRHPQLLLTIRPSLAVPREGAWIEFPLDLYGESTNSDIKTGDVTTGDVKTGPSTTGDLKTLWFVFVVDWLKYLSNQRWLGKDLQIVFTPTHHDGRFIEFAAATRQALGWYFNDLEPNPIDPLTNRSLNRVGMMRSAMVVLEPQLSSDQSQIHFEYEGIDNVMPNSDFLMPWIGAASRFSFTPKLPGTYDAMLNTIEAKPIHSYHSPYLEYQVACATVKVSVKPNQLESRLKAFGRHLEEIVREMNLVELQFHHGKNLYFVTGPDHQGGNKMLRLIGCPVWLIGLLLLTLGPFFLDLPDLVNVSAFKIASPDNTWRPLQFKPSRGFPSILHRYATGCLMVTSLITVMFSLHQVGIYLAMDDSLMESRCADGARHEDVSFLTQHSLKLIALGTMLATLLTVKGVAVVWTRSYPTRDLPDSNESIASELPSSNDAPSKRPELRRRRKPVAEDTSATTNAQTISAKVSMNSSDRLLDCMSALGLGLRCMLPVVAFGLAMKHQTYILLWAPIASALAFLTYLVLEVKGEKASRILATLIVSGYIIRQRSTRELIGEQLNNIEYLQPVLKSKLFSTLLSRINERSFTSSLCTSSTYYPVFIMSVIFVMITLTVTCLAGGVRSRHVTKLWMEKDEPSKGSLSSSREVHQKLT